MSKEKKPSYGMTVDLKSEKEDGFHKEFFIPGFKLKALLITAVSVFVLLLAWGVVSTELFKWQLSKARENGDKYEAEHLENEELLKELSDIKEMNTILSATVTHKVAEEEDRKSEESKLFIPDGIPVNGTASYKEKSDDDERPYLEFTADMGTEIVSAGSGKVIISEEDPEWGYRISIDHGNGYVTSYHVRETPKFIVGAEVRKGDVLFAVTKNNRTLEYQIYKEGRLINPVELMEVFG